VPILTAIIFYTVMTILDIPKSNKDIVKKIPVQRMKAKMAHMDILKPDEDSPGSENSELYLYPPVQRYVFVYTTKV